MSCLAPPRPLRPRRAAYAPAFPPTGWRRGAWGVWCIGMQNKQTLSKRQNILPKKLASWLACHAPPAANRHGKRAKGCIVKVKSRVFVHFVAHGKGRPAVAERPFSARSAPGLPLREYCSESYCLARAPVLRLELDAEQRGNGGRHLAVVAVYMANRTYRSKSPPKGAAQLFILNSSLLNFHLPRPNGRHWPSAPRHTPTARGRTGGG